MGRGNGRYTQAMHFSNFSNAMLDVYVTFDRNGLYGIWYTGYAKTIWKKLIEYYKLQQIDNLLAT